MRDLFDNDLFCILVILAIGFVILVGGTCLLGWAHMEYLAVPTMVYVDDVKVFEGPSDCVNVESSGATTKVTTFGPPLCFRLKAIYVSNDVRVEGGK